jgi:hypothetical protein
MSPERLPQRGEGVVLAFEPSVAGEARRNRTTLSVSNDVGSRELNRLKGYYLVPLPIDSVIWSAALFP